MMLSAGLIKKELNKGKDIGCDDPLAVVPLTDINDQPNGSASVDLRLGTWFVTLRKAKSAYMNIFSDEEEEAFLTKSHYVPFGQIYYLHPRSFVLGTTMEWIRMPCNMGAYVVGKSSWGRRGLIIATATGVHPGFIGCLTLELSNIGEMPVAITPGMKICQLFIHKVDRDKNDKDTDKSKFIGLRKPSLGKVSKDEFLRKMENNYTPVK
jgi:dCTP deaminase